MANTDYGTDISTFIQGGLDPNFNLIQGPLVVAENVARRLSTANGQIDDDIGYGFDLTSWINAVMDEQLDEKVMEILLRKECRKDPRVDDASVQVSQVEPGVFRCNIKLYLIEGETFALVLTLSSLTQKLEILKT